MNWKKLAAEDLESHELRRESLRLMREKQVILDLRMTGLRAGISDSTPIRGGGNRAQEKLISCIAEKERLGWRIKEMRRMVRLIDDALSLLTLQEQRILELLYIRRERGAIGTLANELHVERSQVYRLRDAALLRFTSALYGPPEG